MGMSEGDATVAPPITTDKPVEMTMALSIDLTYDRDDKSTWALTTPRPGHEYDPREPITWAYCHTCGSDLEEIHDTHESLGDYDIVRCESCGFEEHI
jgi:hypothetical protein